MKYLYKKKVKIKNKETKKNKEYKRVQKICKYINNTLSDNI